MHLIQHCRLLPCFPDICAGKCSPLTSHASHASPRIEAKSRRYKNLVRNKQILRRVLNTVVKKNHWENSLSWKCVENICISYAFIKHIGRPEPWASFLRAEADPERDERDSTDFFYFSSQGRNSHRTCSATLGNKAGPCLNYSFPPYTSSNWSMCPLLLHINEHNGKLCEIHTYSKIN